MFACGLGTAIESLHVTEIANCSTNRDIPLKAAMISLFIGGPVLHRCVRVSGWFKLKNILTAYNGSMQYKCECLLEVVVVDLAAKTNLLIRWMKNKNGFNTIAHLHLNFGLLWKICLFRRRVQIFDVSWSMGLGDIRWPYKQRSIIVGMGQCQSLKMIYIIGCSL